jgi:hypothetical protein
MWRKRREWTARIVAIAAVVSAAAIAAAQGEPGDPAAEPLSAQTLRNALVQTVDAMEDSVREAYRGAQPSATTDEQRQALLAWRVYMIDQSALALENDSPRTGWLDLWGMLEQMHTSLDTEETRRQLGPAYGPILEATKNANAEVERQVALYLPKEAYQQADRSIEEYAKKQPLSLGQLTRDVGGSIRNNFFSLFDLGKSTVSTIASVPLMPQKAVQGVREGAGQLESFNQTAARFTEVVEKLPAETREQAQLLLSQLADQQTTLSLILRDLQATAAGWTATAQAGTTMSVAAQRAIDSSAVAAERYEATARAIESASIQTTALIEAIRSLTPSEDETTAGDATPEDPDHRPFDPRDYETAARAIGEGSAELTQTIGRIGELVAQLRERDATDDAEPGRPFDIMEVQTTALAVGRTADRLGALLRLAGEEVEDGRLESAARIVRDQVRPTLDDADRTARGLIDHLAWRAICVLLAAFALGLVLVAIHHNLARRRGR